MSQTLTGTALEGTGSLITEVFDTAVSLPTQNALVITNTGASTYVNIEAEDKTSEFFSTGSNLTIAPFSDLGGADGQVAQSSIVSLAGSPDNSVWSWKTGLIEYQFIATSTNPLPADTVEYLSNDFQARRHKFYCKWSATAGTLGTELVGKINDVVIDGMDEFNALFSAFGLFQLETTKPTSRFNGMTIFRNGVAFAIMDEAGKDNYPNMGGKKVNGEGKSNVNTLNIPFVADKTKMSIFVPNTQKFFGGSMVIAFATLNGTFAANQLRINTAGSGDNLQVEVVGA